MGRKEKRMEEVENGRDGSGTTTSSNQHTGQSQRGNDDGADRCFDQEGSSGQKMDIIKRAQRQGVFVLQSVRDEPFPDCGERGSRGYSVAAIQ